MKLETDLLSDVVRVLHVEGRILCRWEVSAPYGVWFPAGDHLFFHLVREGSLLLGTTTAGERTLRAGDVVLVTHGERHQLTDAERTAPRFIGAIVANDQGADGVLRTGGGRGQAARGLSGVFRIRNGHGLHPLHRLLPPVLQLDLNASGNARLRATFDLYAEELSARPPGYQAVISRLTDVIFVQLVRRWMEENPGPAQASWLGAVQDPEIGASLLRIHEAPGRGWSVDELARSAGMSRSRFASRFTALVGEPPVQYATRWKLQAAAAMLLERHVQVSEVAYEVGYGSLAAFSRAFTRAYGTSPAQWRKRVTAGS